MADFQDGRFQKRLAYNLCNKDTHTHTPEIHVVAFTGADAGILKGGSTSGDLEIYPKYWSLQPKRGGSVQPQYPAKYTLKR